MKLVEFSINRPVTTYMMIATILLLGAIAFFQAARRPHAGDGVSNADGGHHLPGRGAGRDGNAHYPPH